MSCTITPPVHPNPMIHNKVIENLQSDIAGCGWVDHIYPLAEVVEREISEQKVLVPAVYGQQVEGMNNYIELFPDGNERARCFFELPGGDYSLNRVEDTFDFTIKLIVTAQLNKLASRDYDFTDELIASVVQALDGGYYKNDITSIRVIKDRNQVFSKYGYTMNQFFSFMYPKTAFAIEINMTLNSDLSCFNAGSFATSFSPEC